MFFTFVKKELIINNFQRCFKALDIDSIPCGINVVMLVSRALGYLTPFPGKNTILAFGSMRKPSSYTGRIILGRKRRNKVGQG